ncbi:MAG TPA: aldehyde dehydrogenase family protein, partial [Verrucomicrobiae bacterium]
MTAPPAQLFVNGESCNTRSGATIPQINPATEETFVEVAAAGRPEVELAVAGAQHAFEQGWRDLPPGKRTEILFHVSRLIREN